MYDLLEMFGKKISCPPSVMVAVGKLKFFVGVWGGGLLRFFGVRPVRPAMSVAESASRHNAKAAWNPPARVGPVYSVGADRRKSCKMGQWRPADCQSRGVHSPLCVLARERYDCFFKIWGLAAEFR